MRRYRKEFVAIILLGIVILVCSMSYAYAMSAPIPSVIITSENVSFEEKVPGSWQVEKSAKWISKGKSRVTFDVDTILMAKEEASDIIFVVDTSGSMEGDKLEQVKIDSTNLINDILSNTNNNVALIEFNSNATILSNFTNNKDFLINEINNLQVRDSTNYYNAFLKVEELLQSYQKQNNSEVVMLFLTDGYPYEGNPNQITEYKYLKEAYPYLTVNAIQYEMGDVIIDQLKEVSDNQYIAYTTNLNDILSEASITPIPYEEFQIIDYIDNDYYTLNSVDDIKVSDGQVKLEEENGVQKITWTIPNYLSGRKTKLTMDISLKDEYIGQGGVYPTNKSEQVISKIENQTEDVNSNLTPTLAEKYQVIYDGNAPEGSSVENIPSSESQSVFDTVEITEEEPTCSGYIFQGWEIVTDNVKKIGSDYFIMPEENVVLRAKWSSIKLAKSMDGVVSEQGDPIMKGSSWWTSEYDKADVTSIEVKTNTDIPDTAIYSWDASQAGDRSVIAYLEDDGSGNGTYKVTIGGHGGVIANSNCRSLFEGFTNVTSINLNNFDTSTVWNMEQMFSNCSSLGDLDLSFFNTFNVTELGGMFQNCSSLVTLNLDNFNVEMVRSMHAMFSGCSSLLSLDLSGFKTTSLTSIGSMFQNCDSLVELNISNFDTSKVTVMTYVFNGCSSLERLDVSSFNTSMVTSMHMMFNRCNSLVSLDLSGFDTSNVTNMGFMFASCYNLNDINLNSFQTSKVTNMSYMFRDCHELSNVDLSCFDTSNVTTMRNIFYNCTALTSLDLGNFDTSNVTDMSSMFAYCINLEELNISNFNTQNLINMSIMFQGCRSLTSLDLSSFDTSNVTDMSSMFAGCNSLTELNLSSFDTSSVINMSGMFNGCSGLKNLDFSRASFDNVTTYNNMFSQTSNLEVVVKDEVARNWVQDKLRSNGTAIIVSA